MRDPPRARLTSRQHYDVEVVTTSFSMQLWEALALVHSSDVFLGMHGAGFTNLLALHKVGPDIWCYDLVWLHSTWPCHCKRFWLRTDAERDQCDH